MPHLRDMLAAMATEWTACLGQKPSSFQSTATTLQAIVNVVERKEEESKLVIQKHNNPKSHAQGHSSVTTDITNEAVRVPSLVHSLHPELIG